MKAYFLIEADEGDRHYSVNDEIDIDDQDKLDRLVRLGYVTTKKPKVDVGSGNA